MAQRLLESFDENRRPGLTAIIEEMREKNPTWTYDQLRNAAKEEWHRRDTEKKA